MNDSPSTLAVKYVFRLLHVGSLIGLSYKIIKDYSEGAVSTENISFFSVLGVVAALSGFANTFILKPKQMGEKRKAWIGWHHFKLLITCLLYCPLYRYLPGNIAHTRFYWLLVIILVSPAARFYREYYVKQEGFKKI